MLQDVNRPMTTPTAESVKAGRRRPTVVWTVVVVGILASVAWIWLG